MFRGNLFEKSYDRTRCSDIYIYKKLGLHFYSALNLQKLIHPSRHSAYTTHVTLGHLVQYKTAL